MLYEIYHRVICDLGWKGPLEVQLPPLIKDWLFQVAQGPVQSSSEHLQVWRLQLGQLISEFHRENFFFYFWGYGVGVGGGGGLCPQSVLGITILSIFPCPITTYLQEKIWL